MNKPKVAFVCVHNSCRSQIAEALGRLLANEMSLKAIQQEQSEILRLTKMLYA